MKNILLALFALLASQWAIGDQIDFKNGSFVKGTVVFFDRAAGQVKFKHHDGQLIDYSLSDIKQLKYKNPQPAPIATNRYSRFHQRFKSQGFWDFSQKPATTIGISSPTIKYEVDKYISPYQQYTYHLPFYFTGQLSLSRIFNNYLGVDYSYYQASTDKIEDKGNPEISFPMNNILPFRSIDLYGNSIGAKIGHNLRNTGVNAHLAFGLYSERLHQRKISKGTDVDIVNGAYTGWSLGFNLRKYVSVDVFARYRSGRTQYFSNGNISYGLQVHYLID